jgi:predicted tellurium resistance membrane protein TerC
LAEWGKAEESPAVMSDEDDEPPDGGDDGFADRWALVVLSVLMSMFGMIVALLMLGSLAAGVEWLAPLLALVVIMSSVVGIGVAAAAIVLGKQGRWAAFVFAVLPCITVVSAWAWEMRHGR